MFKDSIDDVTARPCASRFHRLCLVVLGHPIGFTSLVVLLVVSALVASSCANAQNKLHTVEVNALWVGVVPESGEQIGGVTPVLIRYSSQSEELDIDVEAQQASGAGAQWVAASWLGATTSLLDHTIDPASVRLVFEISESIDGPSAGALMAVGVAAAIRGDPVRSKMAMTGTVEVDGSIGDVGGIPQKVRGAAAAGMETVLIPSGQRSVQDPDSGHLVDMVALGTRLGVDVREVDDIGQAYEAMTGVPLHAIDRPLVANPVSKDFEKQLVMLTKARLKQVDSTMRLLDAAQSKTGDSWSDWYQRAVDAIAQAKGAIKSGGSAVAYESGMTARLVSQQALSVKIINDSIRSRGVAFAREELLAKARDLDIQARVRVQELARNSKFSESGRAIAFGDALAWVTTGGLVAFLTVDGLEAAPPTSELLREAAAAIARSQVYFETSRDALVLLNELHGGTDAAKKTHLALADLMWEAGSASLAYLDDVTLARAWGQRSSSSPGKNSFLESPDADYVYVSQSEAYLEKLIVGLDAPAAATVKSAVALERYVYASYLVAKYDTILAELDGDGYVSGVGDTAQLGEYVDLAKGHIDELMSEAAAAGFDTSYLHLLSEWGQSLHDRGVATNSALDEAYGLVFLWRAFVMGQIHRLASS
jgi:hypothetical protein